MKRIALAVILAVLLAITISASEGSRLHYVVDSGEKQQETYGYFWYYYPGYWDMVEGRHPVLVECEDWELEELVRTMYLEAGAESEECIRAVTDCTFNQLNSGYFGSTLYEVLSRPGNFDETYPYIWTIEPSERVREIVMDIYTNGIGLPARVMFFRNQYFHDIYWSIPEFVTDNVFFSSSRWIQ